MSGVEKLVEQIIETLNENKAVDIVKIKDQSIHEYP